MGTHTEKIYLYTLPFDWNIYIGGRIYIHLLEIWIKLVHNEGRFAFGNWYP